MRRIEQGIPNTMPGRAHNTLYFTQVANNVHICLVLGWEILKTTLNIKRKQISNYSSKRTQVK